jgi:hypothetical protein
LTSAAERTVLTHALHLLLQALPQAYSGRENIKRLCQTILNATPHMRLVWVGFADGGSDQVEPYVTAGDSVPESEDWRLLQHCFDINAPYSQSFPDASVPGETLSPLFLPWQNNRDICSADCGLAIPLQL